MVAVGVGDGTAGCGCARATDASSLLAAIVETSDDAIYSATLSGMITTWNSGAERLYGYLREEAVGQHISFLAPGGADEVEAILAAARRGERVQTHRTTRRTRSGVIVDLSLTACPIRSGDGVVIGASVVAQDLADRLRADAVTRAAEGRYRQIVETTLDGVWTTDEATATTFVNQRMAAMLGYTPEEMLGRSMLEFQFAADRPGAALAHERRQHGVSEELELRLRAKDGSERWALLATSPLLDGDGRYVGALAMVNDITERRHAQEQLRCRAAQQAVAAALGQRALEGQDLDALMEEVARTAALTLGMEYAQVVELSENGETTLLRAGYGWRPGYVGSARVPATAGTMAGLLIHSARPVVFAHAPAAGGPRLSAVMADHGVVCGLGVPIAGRGRPYGALALHSTTSREFTEDDVHFVQALANTLAAAVERDRAEAEQRHHAVHDPLTGLPNRTLLLDRLGRSLLARREHEVAVLLIALDRFRLVNDSGGHDVGDDLLRVMADRLQAVVRPEDTVARIGGDEFAVVFDPGSSDPLIVARRTAVAIAEPVLLSGREVVVTASVGLASADGDSRDPATLLSNATAAMRRAKALGGSRVQRYQPAMRSGAAKLLELDSALRHAVERDELRVHYQPKVSLDDGAAVGCEALVRWQRPGVGLVPPADFIPLAEDTGLIVPIGKWVLRQACEQAVRWNQERPGRPLSMAVNLSARQLAEPDLVALVADILAETGLDPALLYLEITESTLMADTAAAARALAAIKDLGVHLSIDDFGTGYSSLSYLKRFPCDEVKLDRTFIADLARDPVDRAIVRAVVTMAHALGHRVTPEGVETVEQLSILRSIGCDWAQGYYWSRPLPAAELDHMLLPGATLRRAPPADQRPDPRGRSYRVGCADH